MIKWVYYFMFSTGLGITGGFGLSYGHCRSYDSAGASCSPAALTAPAPLLALGAAQIPDSVPTLPAAAEPLGEDLMRRPAPFPVPSSLLASVRPVETDDTPQITAGISTMRPPPAKRSHEPTQRLTVHASTKSPATAIIPAGLEFYSQRPKPGPVTPPYLVGVYR